MPRAGGYKESGKSKKPVKKETPPQQPSKKQAERQKAYEEMPDKNKQGTKKPGSQNKRK